jgi:nucleotide-binding universal stress UspA family protein
MQSLVESEFQKCMLAAPDRILVATDLSDIDYLVPHAIAQARVCGAKLTFAHVIQPASATLSDPGANPNSASSHHDPAKVIRDARLALLGIEHQVEAHGITCETRVCQGGVSEAIAREIRRTDATRLIVGVHGRGKLGRLTLGSVATKLLTSIDVPVMAVGPQARNLDEHATPRRILHPVSLMGIDHNSIQLPLNVAQVCRAELTLLHVIDPDLISYINPGRVIEWAGNRLKGMVPATDLMPTINTRVSCGELAEEILKAADQTHADLILLGSGGCNTRSLSECVAYKVMTAAPCPVLTYIHEPYRSQIEALEAMHFKVPASPYEQDSISRRTPGNRVHIS